MNLEQFHDLGDERKWMIIEEQAILLGLRKQKRGELALFQLDSFYIEIYLPVRYVEELLIFYFEDTEMLEPYFPMISLEDVYAIIHS